MSPLKKVLGTRTLLCCAVISLSLASHADMKAAASENPNTIDEVLSWLPADTETVTVANGPFWMSDFGFSETEQKDPLNSAQILEKAFQSLTLGLFGFKKSNLAQNLERQKVVLAIEGSRHFRSAQGLGELPYEGCAIAVFADDLGVRSASFIRDTVKVASRSEQIEGQNVVVFQDKLEEDLWTVFVAFPKKNVVIVAADEGFLREVLKRIQGHAGARALPDTLPEWKYVNKKSQFWGLRHFDNSQFAKRDPTSPFGGRKTANMQDEQAIGLSFVCDPGKERSATITYLSGNPSILTEIKEQFFPTEAETGIKDLNIRYRSIGPAAVQGSFDLSKSDSLGIFLFVVMMRLGHGVYV